MSKQLSNILITGGAGFIGCNAALHFSKKGNRVTVLDNLSRPGADKNLQWLRETLGGDSFEFIYGDVRNVQAVAQAVKGKDVVIHLAGQVAVTTSIANPRDDFENNALGTLNVLEAARVSDNNPIVLFSSTNKVYGGMETTAVLLRQNRYEYRDYPLGISESYPLDFHSPYGCSKGAADQYVRDYARIYGLRTVVFRQSCIYGPRQMGFEDQGWLAWFVIAAVTGKQITIYGDGMQVRDVLYVDDLVSIYECIIARIDVAAGKVYNVGGGPMNTISVWSELSPYLQRLIGHRIMSDYAGWRQGDQSIYISDIRKAQTELGWSPQVGVEEGLQRLFVWVVKNRNLFE